jgi:hypothetical protein
LIFVERASTYSRGEATSRSMEKEEEEIKMGEEEEKIVFFRDDLWNIETAIGVPQEKCADW